MCKKSPGYESRRADRAPGRCRVEEGLASRQTLTGLFFQLSRLSSQGSELSDTLRGPLQPRIWYNGATKTLSLENTP